MSFEHTKQFFRAPVGFGPAPSPRQGPDGKPFVWKDSTATTIGVTFSSEHDALDALLPDGYEVERDKPAVIMFEVCHLRAPAPAAECTEISLQLGWAAHIEG